MLKIRRAERKDLLQIAKIERECFSKHDRFSDRQFRYLMRNAWSFLVAEQRNKTIGYLVVTRRVTSLRIYSLAVTKSARRSGVARELLKWTVAEPLDLSLEVRATNYPAIALYQRLGFVATKLLPRYYGNGDGLKLWLRR